MQLVRGTDWTKMRPIFSNDYDYQITLKRCGCIEHDYDKERSFQCPTHFKGEYTKEQYDRYLKKLNDMRVDIIRCSEEVKDRIKTNNMERLELEALAARTKSDMGDIVQAITSLMMLYI